MNCLVTGATGHLGANLVRRLLRDGHKVRVLIQDPTAVENAAVDGLAVDRVLGDIRNLDAMRGAARGVSEVFHVAAKISTIKGGEREIYDINVLGTRNVLRAAREAKVRRTVVTGSFSAVGHTPERPSREEDPFFPFDEHLPYAFTKAFVEQECWTAAAAGQDVVVATSCALLGPHDYFPSRMGAVLRDFGNGKMRAYLPGGFDFVAAKDICEGHVLAMEKGRSGQKYIFSTRFLEVDELMGIMSNVTGRPLPPLRLPPVVMSGIAHVSTFFLTRFFPKVPLRFTPFAVRYLQMRRRADTSKAQRELGFQPTSIEDAVQDAYDDFVARGEIPAPKKAPRRGGVGTGRREDEKNGIAGRIQTNPSRLPDFL
jgi:nucleoside-diphosphate-sugar epimerase